MHTRHLSMILIRETPCPGIGYARLSLAGAVKSLRHCALLPHPIIEVGREDGGLETEVSRQLCVNVPEGFLRSHDDASDAQEELQRVYTLHEHERAKGIPDQFSPTNGRDYVKYSGSHRQKLTSRRPWCEPRVVSLYMALATDLNSLKPFTLGSDHRQSSTMSSCDTTSRLSDTTVRRSLTRRTMVLSGEPSTSAVHAQSPPHLQQSVPPRYYASPHSASKRLLLCVSLHCSTEHKQRRLPRLVHHWSHHHRPCHSRPRAPTHPVVKASPFHSQTEPLSPRRARTFQIRFTSQDEQEPRSCSRCAEATRSIGIRRSISPPRCGPIRNVRFWIDHQT